ncbi:MAG: hypothetical protein K2N63_03755, partial [Lachnospiraceae bacterium]|nr:hypothetical protein [Lachnospiraceae bacterium]
DNGYGNESVSPVYQASGQNHGIVAIPTGMPGTDANSAEDYEVQGVAFVPRNKPATAHRYEEECIR